VFSDLARGGDSRRRDARLARQAKARTTNRFAGETPALLYPALGFGIFIKMRPSKKIRIFPLDFDFRAGMILSLCLTGACRKGVPEGAPGDRKTCGKNLQKKG
jgi:hypothetical protein